jgi:pimeloyl-ACP methyl ester carboxylesterase
MHRNPARLFLLPGLGADQRLFAKLGAPGLPVIPVCLPAPAPGETMPAYSLRVAASLSLNPQDWIGGSSFGSLVAADIARHRPLAGLVLIGGALGSEALATSARWLGRFAHLLPLRLLRPMLARRSMLDFLLGPLDETDSRLVAEMIADTPDSLLREGSRLAASYFPRLPLLCPVHAIHGDRDCVMSPPPLARALIVQGAGHLIALSHPGRVNAFLHEVIYREPVAG